MPKLFTSVESWEKAPVGTLGFYHGSSLFSNQIEKLEPLLTPDTDFWPSHVFMKFDQNHVVEAIKNARVNSVAAIDNSDMYEKALENGYVRLLCPPGSNTDRHASLIRLVNTFGNKPYGTSVLLGFLVQKLFGLDKNPLGNDGDVCSQAAWWFLQDLYRTSLDPETKNLWRSVLATVPEQNSAPLNLYQACLAA